MAKASSLYYCKECGNETSKWSGQCPSCREWNTLVLAPSNKATGSSKGVSRKSKVSFENIQPITLADVEVKNCDRISTGMGELDLVLGGGIVPGSLVLVGGDPGIGKSTLLLQVALKLSELGHKLLYVSGEESNTQIKLRADRLGKVDSNMLLLCETDLLAIENIAVEMLPDIVIIDSIQTMYHEDVTSTAGSVAQVREATGLLMRLAKTNGISIFIVGHVTKDGNVAGPKMLEHMVDTVLYFEGDRHASYRILRGVKNRFGSTNEIGVFEMCKEGLIEVENPSEFMLNGRAKQVSGSAVACLIEGTRPIMVEVQALVTKSVYGMARRQATGADFNRMNLLIAVLEKKLRLELYSRDIYVNIAGGMKVLEPALDLGIAYSIISAYKGVAIPEGTIVFGELGLGGEVRAVSQASKRVSEAKKLGFTTCVMPKSNAIKMEKLSGMKIIAIDNIQDYNGGE